MGWSRKRADTFLKKAAALAGQGTAAKAGVPDSRQP